MITHSMYIGINHADYFSKQHPTKHHIEQRPVYLHIPENATNNHGDHLQLTEDDEIILNTIQHTDRTSNCEKGVLIPSSGLPSNHNPESVRYDPRLKPS
jgi:hypothetical protein